MSALANFVLTLSQEGNGAEIRCRGRNAIIPEQAAASACKTHAEVLSFLRGINESAIKGHIACYHRNNRHYEEHAGNAQKDDIHLCPLDGLIHFVEVKMGEVDRSKPRSCCVIL